MPHSPQEFYKKMELSGGDKARIINKKSRLTGRAGERLAVKYLKRQGYKILARNWRNPFGEVDIIASMEGVVAFIEVKARSTDVFGAPSEAVDSVRKRRYKDAARFYFAGREIDCVVRFDVIEVEGKQLNHIISAFEA